MQRAKRWSSGALGVGAWGWLPTTLAVLWLIVMGLAYLAPAFSHGSMLGPYDFMTQFGLTTVAHVTPHNIEASDQIQEMIPWTNLVWQQVHAGHLPLWDPYSGLGLPLAFNFQSSAFSLPVMVSWLFPLNLAYTVAVVMKIVIAGTGVLFLGRVMGLSTLAAAFAGTVFELSGAFTGWLGWPQSGVMCWLGWIVAAVVLVLRARRLRWSIPLLAVSIAFAIFGGAPESAGITAATVGIMILVIVVWDLVARRDLRAMVKPLASLVGGLAGGIALAAPLLLPGIQVLNASAHFQKSNYVALPGHESVNLIFAGYSGFPVLHSDYFDAWNYYESAAYVGVVVIILAALGALVRWRRPEVSALTVCTAVLAVIVFVEKFAPVLNGLPLVDLVRWNRGLMPLDFLLAVLAGVGLQSILEGGHTRRVQRLFALGCGIGTGALLYLALSDVSGLAPTPTDERMRSFVWPVVGACTAVAALGALLVVSRGVNQTSENLSRWSLRWRRTIAGALVAVEVAFLLTAAPDLWSASSTGLTKNAALTHFEQDVGTGRVGFGYCPNILGQPSLGILAEVNSEYAVSEFAVYDPIVPKEYFKTWKAATGAPIPLTYGNFCPQISNATLAREFGVAAIIQYPGQAPPAGTLFEGYVGGEALYKVPGSGLETLAPAADPAASSVMVPTSESNPGTITSTVDAPAASTLVIHLSDVAGWSATIDGRPLTLERWQQSMYSASIPTGRHRVVLSYWPSTFTVGIVLAALAVLAWVGALVVPILLRRRLQQRAAPA